MPKYSAWIWELMKSASSLDTERNISAAISREDVLLDSSIMI